MTMFFDFEATAPTNNCFDPEQKKCLLCLMRAGWSVTKIYSHYTFEQECFKKKIILMNQLYRQNAKNLFVPIFDELQEITYLKRYYNYLHSKVSRFVSSDLIRQEMEEKYND